MPLIIDGAEIAAEGFMWDSCHKFYLVRDASDRESMLEAGWSAEDILPIDQLPAAWRQSCPLRFISSGDLAEQFVAQGVDAKVTFR